VLVGRSIVPLVTDRRHIGQQHLEHHLLALERPLARRLHLHPGPGVAAATWRERALTFNFDNTDTAVPIRAIPLFVTKVGNVDSVALGRFED
jgi:hypothetical protein